LVFEKIRIDRACPHAEMPGQIQHLVRIFESVRQIPTDVQRKRGQIPVSARTMPASLNFSSIVAAAAG
jgi:hypothetical protein